ncbi:hypothetical protein B0T26DRAFT_501900 [Lasiosphaeria miniovina]|uniref:Uncharacterized protein n=1 Tax=Lasiosphaeria miniovina TaxID=1954250 RepID=A0AA39ZTZ6_9PEZI|nr:uncharacterized protein B0T26DRAFT_501900 [Lasiosphaeria miniovina]KAK0703495.1 hypothetical protein B0T26DRAFT_501900 [Lasiosphaeria miniovina]
MSPPGSFSGVEALASGRWSEHCKLGNEVRFQATHTSLYTAQRGGQKEKRQGRSGYKAPTFPTMTRHINGNLGCRGFNSMGVNAIAFGNGWMDCARI